MKKNYTPKNILVFKVALAAAAFVLGACGDMLEFGEGASDVPPVESAYMYFANPEGDEDKSVCIVRWTLPEGKTDWYAGVLIYIWSYDMPDVVQVHENNVKLRSKSITGLDSEITYYLTVYTSNTAGILSKRFDWTYKPAAPTVKLTYKPGNGSGAQWTETIPKGIAHTVAWPGSAEWPRDIEWDAPNEDSVFSGWEDDSKTYYKEGSTITLSGNYTLTALWSDGSADNPYLIWHQGDGDGGLQNINNGLDKNYKVAVDFTITPPYTAPGTFAAPFTGVFDGNGKTILWDAKGGLTPSLVDPGELYGAGVIAYAGGNGVIKNLAVDGDILINSAGYVSVGGIAGYAAGIAPDIDTSKRTKIENCASYVNIRYTGAVSGDSDISIGGIAGTIGFAEISNCYSGGNIISLNSAGGIAGTAANAVTISNCYAFGTVTSCAFSSSYAAGIAGVGESDAGDRKIEIKNCVALNSGVYAMNVQRVICFDKSSKGQVLTNNYGLKDMNGAPPTGWVNDKAGNDGADFTNTNKSSWGTGDSTPGWTIADAAGSASEESPWWWNSTKSHPMLWFETE